MNPADLPQLGLSSSDLSLLTLFLQAHWISQDRDGRAPGLLGFWSGRSRSRRPSSTCAPARRDGPSFEQAFPVRPVAGGALSLALGRPPIRWRPVRGRDAEWKRSLEGEVRSFAGLQMRIGKGDGGDHRPRDRAPGAAVAGAGHGRLHRPLRRPVRHGLGAS